MNRAARIGIIVVSVVVFLYAGLGHVLGRSPDDRAYKSLTVYAEVLQKIQQDYVDDPNMHMVTAGALHGLLESLDPESSYLTPREYTEYKEKIADSAGGETGLTLSKRYGYIIVISVLPGSSAEKAGIHSGDILEEVGGFTTREMSVGQAFNLLHGTPGTSVKVGVVRSGNTDPDEIEIVREKLAPEKMLTQKTDPDILAMRLQTLNPGRAEQVKSMLQEAQKQGVHKVILDVRNCGRGPVSEAIAIAQLFVPSGTLATLRGQTISTQVFTADPNKVVWKGPVSILVDGTTSGAAEVLASAIEANHRGDVVGERTFGLASEQKLIPIEDGSALILTVGNYYNADGKSILEEGVAPTEVVQATNDDSEDDDDSAASADQRKHEKAEPQPLSADDPVFQKAVELLKAPAPAKKAA
jgi:carboxyl-terminal processing protease